MDSANSAPLDSDPPSPTPPVQTGAASEDSALADQIQEDSSESERAVLGFKINESQRAWLLKNYYEGYLQHKCTRGTRNCPTAKSYSHELVYDFEKKYLSDWPEAKRLKYRSRIQDIIYNLFNNRYANDDNAQKDREVSKGKAEGKKKISPENLWSSSNRSAVNKAVEKHLKNHPEASRMPGTIRHVVCEEFKKLSEEEKLIWTSKAAEARGVQKAEGQLTGQARVDYSLEWMARLNRLVLEGQRSLGLSFNSIVGWELEDERGVSAYQMDTFLSPDIKDFKDSQEFGDALTQFAKWFRDSKGATVRGCDPAIAVIPDTLNNNRPKMPDLPDDPKLMIVRNLNRQFVNAEYSYMGGVGPAPWTRMEHDYHKGNFSDWVQEGRWPDDLEFKDPSSMNLASSLKAYRHFRKRQDGAPEKDIFQICRVFAGSSPPSGASRQTLVDYCGRKVWMVEYDDYLEKSPSTRPIAYSELTWKYFYFTTKQASLEHWDGLLSVEDKPAVVLFSSDVIAFVRKLLEPADSELCDKVTGIMDTINQIELHAPFTTSDGIWGLSGDAATLPRLLPSSRPDDIISTINSSLLSFWLDEPYFMSGYAAKTKGYGTNASAGHLEYWLESTQDSSLIHKPSKTVQGGECGVVWVAVALIKSLLNAAVTALWVVPPTPTPTGVKLERFGPGEFFKLCDSVDVWSELCSDSLAKLAKTSNERIHPAEPERVSTPALSPDDEDAPDPQPITTSKKKSTQKKGSQPSEKKAASKRKSRSFSEMNKSDSEESGDSDVGSQDGGAQRVTEKKKTSRPFFLDKRLFEPSPIPTNTDTREHVFGLFGAQPDVPEFTGKVQALIDASKELLKESQSALDAWRTLEREYKEPYPPGVSKRAEVLALPGHPACQPLIQAVLMHRFDFNRARSYWPQVKARHQAVLLVFRKLAQIQKTIEDRLSPGGKDLLKPAKKQLQGLLPRLTAKFWACRAIVEVVKDMEKLSTGRANELREAWNNDPVTMRTNDLVQLCHGLGAWRDEAYKIQQDHRNWYIQEWREGNLTQHEPIPSHMIYQFGSPGTPVMPAVAHALLEKYPPGMRVDSPEPIETLEPGPAGTEGTPATTTHVRVESPEPMPAPEPVAPQYIVAVTQPAPILGAVVPVPSDMRCAQGTPGQSTSEAPEPADANSRGTGAIQAIAQPAIASNSSASAVPSHSTQGTEVVNANAGKDATNQDIPMEGGGQPSADTGAEAEAGGDSGEHVREDPPTGSVTEAPPQDAPMADAEQPSADVGAEAEARGDTEKGVTQLGGEDATPGQSRTTRSKSRNDGNAGGGTGGAAGGAADGKKGPKKDGKKAIKRKGDVLDDDAQEDDGLQTHLQTPGAGGSSTPASSTGAGKPPRKRGKAGRK